jgi:hypothetical protein
VIGGLVTATLLTLIVLPVLYIVVENLSIGRVKHTAIVLLALCMFTLHQPLRAQSTRVQVFKSENEFRDSSKAAIYPAVKSVRLTSKSKLIIESSTGMQVFDFGKLYGYRSDFHYYRAFGKKGILHHYGYYKIIDTAGLVLYSRKVYHRKGGPFINYFFSTSTSSPIRMLTLHELRKAYPEEYTFIKRTKPFFRTNFQSLAGKDYAGRARLNKLYLESKGGKL